MKARFLGLGRQELEMAHLRVTSAFIFLYVFHFSFISIFSMLAFSIRVWFLMFLALSVLYGGVVL